MKKETKPIELKVALFGARGSGKTTFLASFFGNLQQNTFIEKHGFRLISRKISDGNDLLGSYYKLEEGKFPLPTEKYREFHFGIQANGQFNAKIDIIFYDYPGGWWTIDPTTEEEESARFVAFSNLLDCHVGIIFFDGAEFIADGTNYICKELDQFKNEINRINALYKEKDPNNNLPIYPDNWVIAISKADLLDQNTTAERVCKKIVMKCRDQLKGLSQEVQADKGTNRKKLGNQFLLISSVLGNKNKVINAHQYMGLTLITPIVLNNSIEECIKIADLKMNKKSLKYTLKKALIALISIIDKVDDFLPAKYQIITQTLRQLDVLKWIDMTNEQLQKECDDALKKGKIIKGTFLLMQRELIGENAKIEYFKNQE